MPKLVCPCGFIHDLSPIPDDGWMTIADRRYEEVIDAEIRRHEITEGGPLPGNDHPHADEYDEMTGIVAGEPGLLYECRECGRLMWRKPGDEEYRVFKPDETA